MPTNMYYGAFQSNIPRHVVHRLEAILGAEPRHVFGHVELMQDNARSGHITALSETLVARATLANSRFIRTRLGHQPGSTVQVECWRRDTITALSLPADPIYNADESWDAKLWPSGTKLQVTYAGGQKISVGIWGDESDIRREELVGVFEELRQDLLALHQG